MKVTIYLFAALLLFSCNASDRNYESLPQCIKDQIDNPEISVRKIGENQGLAPDDKTLYWIFEEGSKFGKVADENCKQSGCYGWCGMTTRQEIDDIFDREWTLLWEK